ncbi:amino acid adenylation domain-containing protein [Jatrophihabitans sp.]|uniref:amino acid adenylation domain-containing protein n=1 Tax=Jatrophihabitans sp. TaxID=1932789 RepID=UPI002BD3C549|nr:amino acid adenylation domain-containing protein [Jatrophihabitans sp.]
MTAAGSNAAAVVQSPDRYPALPTQQGMILNSLRCCSDGVDVLQITLDWAEPVRAEPFEAAWQEAVRRNPVLRTGFELDPDHGLVQVVHPAAALDIRWLELPPAPATGADAEFDAFLRADRRVPFDPARPPLARLSVLRRPEPGSNRRPGPGAGHPAGPVPPACRSVFTFSHALLDGRSMRLLVEEVSRCYAALLAGRSAVPPRRPPFSEFVRWWQMAELADPAGPEEFWTPYLADTVLPRALPGCLGARQPGTARPAEPRKLDTALSRADSDRIRRLAEQAGLGASTVLTAAWALLRARYGGVEDVVLAATRSCRHASIPDADQVMGLLINTVPLRVRIDPGWTVAELLAAVDAGIAEVREHQRTPMADILSWAGLPVDTPLIDSLVMFDRHRLQTGLDAGPAGPVAARVDRLPSYPLSVCCYGEDELQLGMIWDGRRFADGSAERMLAQLRATLLEFAESSDRPLAELSLGASDEAELRRQWNAARAGYPREASVPELFAAQVARHPDAPALEGDSGSWSYAELDRRSTELAWGLRERGIGPDTPVAVALPRGADLIATLLAVLKAGGAYLPIDQGSPPARVAGMIAGAALVVLAPETAAGVPEVDGVVRVELAELGSGRFEALPAGLAHPLSLAYLSFTSGSTGVPKGVAVPHRAVVRLVSEPTFATLGPGQRLLQLAPVAFDASTLEIWGALLTGATLVTAPAGPLGLPEIARLLRTRGVSLAWLTAGLFHQLVEADAGALAEVGQLLAGGDVLNAGAVRTVLAARAGRPLVNGYGPTENTTFTTCHVMTDPDQVGSTVPIGRPIQHTSVHVLDAELRPVPIGVVGELYTGGDGLARCYQGNPAATARAFVPDPSGTGERLYRTGDLVRWRADGVLEFLGRADDQVKVRGFRVEPGEVEAVLRAHPGVREAVVLTRGDGAQRHLVGYVTPADGVDPGTLSPGVLREFLSYRLPDYLVPAGFAVLERFPLNANGKVDRAALPEPEREARQPASPARGETEVRLAEVWRRLLEVETIGRTDNFFALGGNSLSAARLMFRIREEFGVELPMGAFYAAPALADCAAAIDTAAAPPVALSAGTDPAGSPSGGTITRRDRNAFRTGQAGTAPAPPAAATTAPGLTAPASTTSPNGSGIGRRDRSAFRVAAPAAQPAPESQPGPAAQPTHPTDQLAPHLVPLTQDWALWRTVCLRAAGFPLDLLDALGDPALAALADAAATADATGKDSAEAAYAAEFPAAVRRLTAALYDAAGRPALREAIAWQNRRALDTGIDALVRRGPEPASRNTKHRQHEALLASYLQRYCAKNDTIGFFGPVSWARFDDGGGIRVEHQKSAGPVRERVTYLEGWAVRAVLAGHVAALRPWLVPRRMPFLGLDGDQLVLPLAPAVQLSPAEAAVLHACDGIRTARQIAAEVLADPPAGLGSAEDVFTVLTRLSDTHRLVWTVDVAPQDIRPERSMRAVLDRVDDDSVRAPAEAALDALVAGRDALAAAAGDPERVVAAMAGLEETFTRHAGIEPTRRAGELYAGRTLAYEECLRADTVQLGTDAVDGIRSALGLVLDSARWFTAVTGALYARRFTEIYRERSAALGSPVVPFAEFWLLANDALFDQPPPMVEPAVRALQQRWAAILGLPADPRRIQLRSDDLKAAVAEAFPAQPPVWPMAVHHSPDLMIAGPGAAAGGRYTWVLGEIHPSIVTTRYASWLEFADDPAAIRAGMHSDLGRDVVFIAETAVEGGVCSRLSNVLASPTDLRLAFAADSCGYDPHRLISIGDCDLVDSPTGLRVRRRDGSLELGLLEVVGDLLSAVVVQTFHPLPRGTHAPRVSIDDLVVSRESWTLPAGEPPFADTADERLRYARARAWVAEHELPRYVFLRFTGERKPIYADLTSLASIDLIARALRRCRRAAGADATVSVVEMLPTPDQAWLADAQGRRYSAELRMVVADQKQKG